MPDNPRFFCDDHLKRLARWLRAAGIDAAWEGAIEDTLLLERSRSEQRVLLTLDRELAARDPAACLLLPSHDPIEQLRFVRDRFRLDLLSRAFSRCPVCNTPLDPVPSDRVEVPPKVRERCGRFWTCEGCKRTYWHGDHVAHMRERFERL